MSMITPKDRFESLDKEGELRAEQLIHALNLFREYDTAFPMSYAVAFLLVTLKPGLGPQDYAKHLGLHQAVTSRILLEIGVKSRHGGEGMGLIDSVPDLRDLRAKRAFLTPKGKALWNRIDRALGGKLR